LEGPGNDDRRTLGEPEERGEPHEHDETHAAPKGPPEESRKPDASGEEEGADGRNQGRRQPSHDQLRREKRGGRTYQRAGEGLVHAETTLACSGGTRNETTSAGGGAQRTLRTWRALGPTLLDGIHLVEGPLTPDRGDRTTREGSLLPRRQLGNANGPSRRRRGPRRPKGTGGHRGGTRRNKQPRAGARGRTRKARREPEETDSQRSWRAARGALRGRGQRRRKLQRSERSGGERESTSAQKRTRQGNRSPRGHERAVSDGVVVHRERKVEKKLEERDINNSNCGTRDPQQTTKTTTTRPRTKR
jgi:hypothetical protein